MDMPVESSGSEEIGAAGEAFLSQASSAAILNAAGQITQVNRAWRDYFHANAREATDCFVGTSYLDVCDSARGRGSDHARAMSAGIRSVLARKTRNYRLLYPCVDHTGPRWYIASASPMERLDGAVVVHVDVTREASAQIQLDRLIQRFGSLEALESRDQKVRTAIHDLKNSLALIMGGQEMALEELEAEPADARRHLIEAMGAARLASQSCAHALDVEPPARDLRPGDLNARVRRISEFLRPTLDQAVQLRLDLDPRLPAVFMDPERLDRAVTNLMINAVQAIGEESGTVRVRSGVRFLEGQALPEGLEVGQYAFLSIADTGPGIEPENLKQIFQPFYSTKGKGSGLGLASAREIVLAHGGHLSVDSKPGEGACFTLWLPVLDA